MHASIKFVKRFTTVPAKFIDELFRFYTENTRQTDAIILIDDVAKWLECSRIELTRTLQRSYVKDVDYTSEFATNPAKKAGLRTSNNYKRTLITPDCFKRLCMLSRAKKAEMVRTYFIDVESQFLKYKDQLMKGLEADITRLEKDLNPNRINIPFLVKENGYIYIISASSEVDDLFKIGRAKNLKTRLFSYQTGKAHTVDLIYVLAVHDMKSAEACVKAQLKKFQYRTRREVYQVPVDMLKEIINKCNEIDGITKEYTRRKRLTSGGGKPSFYAVFSKDLILPP